jgi:general secretion pathway protein C
MVRARGGDVNGQEVAYIGRDRVWLSKGTSYCQIEMYAPPPATAAPPPPPPERVGARPGVARPLDPAVAKQIQKRGANDYAIERALIDRIVEDPAELMKLAQTLPVTVDGQMVGVRLKGVRPESLRGAIGLQDGDVLERINGFELTSPEKIFGAYAHLREIQDLTVTVTRGGKKVNLDYAIR